MQICTTREGSGIYSGETLAAAQVYNSASMKRAVEKLIKDNLIYTFEGEYRFANPFFREWLKRN